MRHAKKATLEIHPEFTWLAEQHDIDLGETLKNGHVAATMPIGSEEWFIRFALSQADRVRVTSPDSLVKAITDRRLAALDGYTK